MQGIVLTPHWYTAAIMSERSKSRLVLAWGIFTARALVLFGLATVFFTGAPRVFHDDQGLTGPDTAHADAPPVVSCGGCDSCGGTWNCSGSCDCGGCDCSSSCNMSDNADAGAAAAGDA